ncbi:MAG TPA: ATP-binding protein [Halanaerobiales bacterium]|nr:ATP-binding protein [Halanaerobiales bacterium]
MKKITVISGKGGTGKTTVVANLAYLAQDLVLADCDVDAPNLHLLLNPEVNNSSIFKSNKLAIKDQEKCTNCGVCYDVCRFNAVDPVNYEIDEYKCEGCGVCVAMCPEDALSLKLLDTGEIYNSTTRFGPMVHANLKIGSDNSGKLVSEVREKAVETAEEQDKDLLLIDGSPGIGCPVISSITGVDLVLFVTEPSKSGFSDLKRVAQVIQHFNIPALAVINKYDINEKISREIEEYLKEEDIELVGKISYSSDVVDSLRNAQLIVEQEQDNKVSKEIEGIWTKIQNRISQN